MPLLHSLTPLLAAVFGLYLLVTILWEGFETVVLPRTVTRYFRLTRGFYRITWPLTRWVSRRISDSGNREFWLSFFGPVSLPLLLFVWALGLIVGFALLQWAQGARALGHAGFGTALYASGVTFFTLGYGDITPHTGLSRFVAVLEAAVGFGFLALTLAYLPVLYQAFSRREATISRLDGRASSPPTACELLKRHAQSNALETLTVFLREWEQWAAEILESHLSYPVLAYYRSQHEHQSWLGALTAIMDTCALVMVGAKDAPAWQPALQWQARQTFAMARHTIIDLAYVFNTAPSAPNPDRLPPEALARMRLVLSTAGLPLCDGPEDEQKLTEWRAQYEPFVHSLADFMLYSLPPWLPDGLVVDNWQVSAWEDGEKASDFHPA